MNSGITASLMEYLSPLEEAVAELANTWRPDDPEYRADIYRQTLMSLSYGYFAYFHADPEHPDWSPIWNPVYTLQPNPDDIYLYAPLRGDLSYKVSGYRGTVRKLIFVTQRGMAGMVDEASDCGDVNTVDDCDLKIDERGYFEIIFSAKRPEGYEGNWSPLGPTADTMLVRFRSYDWENETDPQLSIECLDDVPLKARLSPEDISERLKLMAKMPVRAARLFFKMQNEIKENVGINTFDAVHIPGLFKQVYWPAVFEFDEGEALIIETDLPEVRPYWNIQLNDPYFNAIEYVYRLSSTNGAMAKVSSDGKLYAVIALEDPGVPNWLDPAGFKQGTIYGRWYDCDTTPTPQIKRVPLAKLRKYLPADTPVVTPEERKQELQARVRACQRRRRW